MSIITNYVRTQCSIFSIDPSIRACGWAFFWKDGIIAGLCRSKEKNSSKAALDIYLQLKQLCPLDLDYLLIERPIIQENWTREKKEAIAKLLVCYGTCLVLATYRTVLWTPSVPEWKGQISKEISHSRTKEILDRNNIEFEITGKVPISLQHNTKDAIAILTSYLIKEGIIT